MAPSKAVEPATQQTPKRAQQTPLGQQLPRGGTTIFPRYQQVAYYSTAHTPALGVLGEGTIPKMTQRLPFVGLALDPEWRMGSRQVPGQTLGHVGAVEVNHVSRVVADVVRNNYLPEKIFKLHQFRREMVQNIANVRDRPGLAQVQHIDGFGTRSQKLATYHHVAEPQQFRMGFKLFYDEDTRIFRPREVLAIRPHISFVSYQ